MLPPALHYTVVVHSSRAHAIVSSLESGRGLVAKFARQDRDRWVRTAVTWFGPAPLPEQQLVILNAARLALLKELGKSGVVVTECDGGLRRDGGAASSPEKAA